MDLGRRALILRGGMVVVAAALTWAHVSAGSSPDISGPLLVLDHLFNLGLVGALLAVCLVTGLSLLRHAGLERAPPLDRLVFGIGLGAGVLGILTLLVGMAGLLSPIAVAAPIALCMLVGARDLRGIPRLVRAVVTEVGAIGGAAGLRVAAIGVTSLAVLFLIALSLTPSADWDSLLLHLRVPSQFLVEGGIYVPPDNLPSGFAAVMHMLYLPLLAAGSPTGPAILSAAIAVVLALTVLAVAKHTFDDDVAHLSLIGLWGCSIVLMVAVTARVDVTLAYFTLLTHYALLKALPSSGSESVGGERRGAHFLLAAVLAGLMVSVKYQGFVYAVALTPLVFVASGDTSTALKMRFRSILVFGCIAVAVALPWIAKNLILFDALFASLFMGPFVLPWMEALYGSRAYPTDGPAAFSGVVWQLRESFNLADFFLAPYRLSIENEALFYFSTPLLLTLPLAAICMRNRMAGWLAGPGLAYAVLLLIYSPRTNLRYLIPAIVVLTIVSAATATAALRKLFSDERSRRTTLVFFLVPLSFLPTVFTMFFWSTQSLAPAHMIGAASPREFATTRPFESVLPLVSSDVIELLPDDARLLLLFEPRGHAFGHTVLQDSQMNHWPLIALAPVDLGCLENSGVTHVLLNMNTLEYRLENGFDAADFEWQAFPEFRVRCLTALYERAGYTLFEVRRTGD